MRTMLGQKAWRHDWRCVTLDIPLLLLSLPTGHASMQTLPSLCTHTACHHCTRWPSLAAVPPHRLCCVQRLPLTLPELVQSSPSRADDGSIVVGTRVSSVFLLHKGTGQLVRLLSGVSGALGEADMEGACPHDTTWPWAAHNPRQTGELLMPVGEFPGARPGQQGGQGSGLRHGIRAKTKHSRGPSKAKREWALWATGW